MAQGKPYPDHVRLRAALLYQEGYSYRKIAKLLGVPVYTTRRWLNPEYAESNRRRSREAKLRRKTTCPGCGKLIWYTSKTCTGCQQHRYWTQERVRQAIQDWVAVHGGPPTSTQWMRRGDNHPAATAIYGKTGIYRSWNDAIADAGYTPRRSTPGPGRGIWNHDEARRLRNAGISDAEIGRRFGVTASAISQGIGRRGKPKPIKQRNLTREQRIEALRKALQYQ